MELSDKNKKVGIIFIGIFLFLVHFYLARTSIYSFSPTYDEPLHLTSGYVYLKTRDYRINGYCHTPFAEIWAALPLIFMNPIVPKQHPAWIRQIWNPADQYQFADRFLFHNRVDGEKMLAAGRTMQIGLSLFLGLTIGFVAWSAKGFWACLFSMGFWAFSPSILAHGGIVSTDLAFAFFFFSFFAFLPRTRSPWWSALVGLSLGLSLGSKYFAISVGPAMAAVILWEWITRKEEIRKLLKQRAWQTPSLIIIFTFVTTMAAIYQFTGFDVFWEGFRQFLGRAGAGRSSFFFGQHGTQGWLVYFPTLILLKTPIPLILSLFMACWFALRKKVSIPSVLWIPPVVFMLIAFISKVQIGHRYVLGIYPFFFVIGGVALSTGNKGKIAGIIFLIVIMIGSVSVKPHFLSYFNEIIGGASQGYRYFTDSNVDWGQGLKFLKDELEDEDKKNGIYLSYFGVMDPHLYGIRYLDVGSDRIAGHRDDSKQPGMRPTKFAISATNLQSTYYSDKNLFSWLKNRNPWKVVAHSIFVFDFKDDPHSIDRLEAMR